MTACVSCIEKQRAVLLAVLGEEVGRGSRYALLDHPDHDNIGDSVIWAGEIALLKQLTGRQPSYAAGVHDYDQKQLERSHGDGVIFFHGGGNPPGKGPPSLAGAVHRQGLLHQGQRRRAHRRGLALRREGEESGAKGLLVGPKVSAKGMGEKAGAKMDAIP